MDHSAPIQLFLDVEGVAFDPLPSAADRRDCHADVGATRHVWLTGVPSELIAVRTLVVTGAAAAEGRVPSAVLERSGTVRVLGVPAELLVQANSLPVQA